MFISGWFFSKKGEIKEIKIVSGKSKLLYSTNNFFLRKDVNDSLKVNQKVFGFACYVKKDSKKNYIQFIYDTESKPIEILLKDKYFKKNIKHFALLRIEYFYKIYIIIMLSIRYMIINKFVLRKSFPHYYQTILSLWRRTEFLDKGYSFKFHTKEIQINSIEKYRLNEFVRSKILEDINKFSHKIKISIVVPVFNVRIDYLDVLMASFIFQLYKNIEIIFVDNGSNKIVVDKLKEFEVNYNFVKLIQFNNNRGIAEATNVGIKNSSGDFIGFADHDDILTEDALYLVAKTILNNKNVKWVYTDEAKIDNAGLVYDYQYKPDFSPALLLSTNYIQHLNVVKGDILKKISLDSRYDGAQDFDLNLNLLRLVDKNSIHHISKVCYLWRSHAESTAMKSSQKIYIKDAAFKSLKNFLKKSNLKASLVFNNIAKKNGTMIFNLKWETNQDEPVTIIIPNRDCPDLISKCLESLKKTCDQKKIKIIIIDDDSKNKETFKIYSKYKNNNFLSFRVLNYKRVIDEFNYSKLINYGVNFVDTKFFIQLNNDIEALNEGWVDQMLGWFSIKNTRIVGANLYYPNNKIQHSGVHIGPEGGLADHIFRGYKDTSNNYFGYLWCSRNVSAVTGACMMMETSFFKKSKGFDENNFKIQFNDVDFCLRTINQGGKIILDPSVKLIHHESVSRGKQYDYSEHINFIDKYENYNDYFYNSNLITESNDFAVDSESNYYFDHFSKFKVLILVHELTQTGAPIVAMNIAKYLVKKGYEVTIFSPSDGPLKKQILSHRINIKIHDSSSDMKLFINDFIKNNEFEIIISNSLFSPWHLLDNHKFIKAKLLNIHESINFNDYYSSNLSTQDFSFLESLNKINSFSALVFQSQSSMQIFNHSFLYKNIKIIPGSLPYGEIISYKLKNNKTKLRTRYGFKSKDFLILNLGTVCERKGQEVFIKAALKLINSSTFNKDTKFLVVGDNDSFYSKSIKKMIPKNYKKYFYFFNETDNFFDFYELSDLYVCSSFQESFPMVVLYAMAFDLPIISTNVNGIKEMISKESSLLIDPGDENKLFSCLVEMIENEDLRSNLKLKAKSKFLRYYKDTKNMSLYQNFIESIVFYNSN